MRRASILVCSLLLSACGGGRATPPVTAPDVHRETVVGEGIAPPEVRLTHLEVERGPLAVDDARMALARMRSRVQACIEASALRVEGSVEVRLDVSPTGAIARSGTDRVEGLDPDIVFCVVRAIRGCQLPRHDAASVVRLGLAFVDPRGVTATSAEHPAQPEDQPNEDAPVSSPEALDDPEGDDASPE